MKFDIAKTIGFGLLFIGAASLAVAATAAPEIDPGAATLPITILGGAALIVRSRIRRYKQ